MKRKIVLYFSSIIVLVTVVSCPNPFSNYTPESYWNVFEGKGTPLYAYVDEDNEISDNDTGKTAVFIYNNPQAEDVMLVSQTAQEPNGDEAVYLSNQNTVIAVFFRNGQRFPWLIDISGDRGQATARLLGYEWGHERFSLEFEENGVKTPMNNIKLSKSVLMNGETNIRLRNLYTAIGVYESISRSFTASGTFKIQDSISALSAAFNDTSYASFAVTVKPEKPIISIDEYVSGEPSPGFIITLIIYLLSRNSSAPPPHPPPPPLEVSITRRDTGATINSDTVLYIEKGEELIIDFKFTNFTQNTNVNIALYDTIYHDYGYSTNNAPYTPLTQADGSPLGKFTENYSIKIKRSMLEGDGFGDGSSGFVVFFGQNTLINGSLDGIQFWEPDTSGPVLNHSVFLIKYSSHKEQEKP